MKKIISFVVGDIIRNRIVLAYTGVLLLFSLGLFNLEPRPEKALLNPIDITRMMIITRMDTAALMGHSGAVFREFLAGAWGWVIAWLALLAWGGLPLAWAVRIFNKKDL